ncbi:ARHGAP42 [Cordylochernes scorpioides]|uniref:ARHGAP42 n=1 Tax=Cordylochernes scorpioides TaxID=51811 RepID=A0ABY6JVC9_9ARAC|nr:ARHGAP42 [Cordylochernes scorpioides]
MGLLPLEFTDCLIDSPYFRENLHAHEKELESTSQAIKVLIRDVKELISAARNLSRAQRNLGTFFQKFNFESIGTRLTDDEIVIAGSLKMFGNLLMAIEDERDRMLERAQDSFIDPIEKFRKEQIGAAKEWKKKFEKDTAKFCQSLERHLNLSTRKSEAQLLDVSLKRYAGYYGPSLSIRVLLTDKCSKSYNNRRAVATRLLRRAKGKCLSE